MSYDPITTTSLTRRAALAGACTLCAVAVTGCATGQASQSDGQPVRVPRAGIDVGGAAVFPEHRILVTQPNDGVYRAFSAVCTHQGCAVTDVDGDVVKCPCHGSKFRLTDGSVAKGPAQRPLPERTATIDGNTLIVS
ncbi:MULTISPECIES: Rieske (2Fe-2S) protein [Nocardia]|uniref:Cytochrome bc1 complex Rieske iron-sulfur subunit n=1 Tax=Nocardia asteroides NBRC 15531 TaxID=1110697 RepID=U5EKX5_NOCAS|nr:MULTISPECIES: Rieske (2Fe-2S) protein [Nocardia]TLF63353.1 Rieske (2Fe-2S) protein [Nocardia asteroides NBRC 15531]UGT47224.1 Rieske (2Fe-2S) protein [Nocardia asteroides]SFM75789.1 Rieske [2Fe-2S] domain-containing protein [Nocardia asteroides]VEG33891.1 Cytochrome b6-f complex iron-sulfur subunit [Nocardia asteroides]GAD87051.1 putative iron-sulfur protein [Nocardia asteroides NBRC 15531]